MEEMINKFDAMLNLVNKYLHETWGVGLYEHEFRDVVGLLRDHNTAKIAAIKYVREATKRSERSDHELFKLDLSNHEGTPISDFTAWARAHNVDLATGEVQVQYLDLKKVKDLVEFIQLNLDKIAG